MKQIVYYIYMDFKNKTTEILCNGKVDKINGFRVCDILNMNVSAICFINNVKLLSKIYPGGDKPEHDYKRKNNTDIISYKYGKCEFRSFSALFGMTQIKHLITMFQDCAVTQAMEKYINSFGNPKDVKCTLAMQAQKKFYEPIGEELWEERKELKKFYWDKQTYDDMMVGVKSGLLSHSKSTYFEDILMFDKRSAYPSVMVNDNKFPVGHIISIGKGSVSNKINKLKQLIKEDVWCKVVVDCKLDGFPRWYDSDAEKSGFEYWNLKLFVNLGEFDNFIEELSRHDFRLYRSSITDYLSWIFRKRVVEVYTEKEQEEKGTIQRHLKKTMIDMLYGKGLQKHDFNEIWQYQRDMRKKRNMCYMVPEFSNHCIARVEYEMFKAIRKTESAYYDTDGIKVKNTKESIEYFENENKRILQANKEAGFDTNIGTWDFEGKCSRFLVFSPKVYVYEHGGKIEAKTAGLCEEYKELQLNNIEGDKFKYLRENGIKIASPSYMYMDGDVKVIFPWEKVERLKGDLQ